MKQTKYARGAPSSYSYEWAEKICEKIATTTKGIKSLCNENPDWPCFNTVFEWLFKHKDFGDLYAIAKKSQVEVFVDELIQIADDSNKDIILNDKGEEIFNREFAARSRIRIDTRKWIACKLNKRYADTPQKTIKEQIEELKVAVDYSKASAEDLAVLEKAHEITARLKKESESEK